MQVQFRIKPGYSNVPITLVSYTAPEAWFDANTAGQQKVFDVHTGFFSAGGPFQLTVDISDSYFQIDFLCGPAIDVFGPAGSNVFYTPQMRLADADNGGTTAPVPNASSIKGSVYFDADNDGVKDLGEAGVGGTTVTLGGALNRTKTTRPDGSYSFVDLPPGPHSLSETQPAAFIDGTD